MAMIDNDGRARHPSRAGSPTYEGEREATRFRIILGIMCLAAIAAAWLGGILFQGAGFALTGTMVGWFLINPLTLLLIGRGSYRPWMSYVSVGADLSFASAVSFAIMSACDFNFAGGLFDAVSFLVILLAGVRRSAALVVATSIAAAASRLIVCAVFFGDALSSWRSIGLVHGGQVVQGINYVDNITKAVCMVIVGGLLAFVTHSLRRSERHYQELFESIPDGIAIADARGAIVTVNRRFLSMVGNDAASLKGTLLADLIGIEPGGDVFRSMPPTAFAGCSTCLKCAGGGSIPVRIATAPMRLRNGEGLVVSVRDVTDHMRMEKELSESRKMDSIGRLAGGLAHDFNNILGGVLGAASVAAQISKSIEGGQGARLPKQIDLIRDSGRSARDVVKKLLDFSRSPSSASMRRFSLAQALSDVETLCRKTFGQSLEITVACSARGEVVIEGDEGALKQALLDLCLKLGDSMPRDGRISLRLEDAPPAPSFHLQHPEAAVDVRYLCVVIEGVGPREDTAPFARPLVGLARIEKLAQLHRGFVDATSGGTADTCVLLYLPRAAEPTAGAPSEGEEGDA